MLVPVIASLVAVAAGAVIAPEAGVSGALVAGARWFAGALLLLAVGELALCFTRPHVARAPFLPQLTRFSGTQLVVLGGAAITIALLRTPHRLMANLIGYAAVAGVVLWLAQRRTGAHGVRTAGLVVALFGLVPTHLNVPEVPALKHGAAGSAYQWSAGWPTSEWRLKHEITLEQPLNRAALLVLQLTGLPTGAGQVHASLNGRALGPMPRMPYGRLELGIATEHLTGVTELAFEFRLSAPDASVRVLTHTWIGGATRGAAASSYFDGQGWRPGTLDDLAGRPAVGAYTIELQPR